MPDEQPKPADLSRLSVVDWGSLSHRQAMAEMAVALEGGGSLAVLEYLASVESGSAALIAARWKGEAAETEADDAGEAGDEEFERMRATAREIDAEFRASTPWWDGFDFSAAHVRRAADGRLVLIDLFCMDGASLYGQILEDVTEVHRRIPRELTRYVLEIPYLARASSAEEISALRRAWAKA